METKVSIGEGKRDLSTLVNRVAYRGERIVLTSRGKPKAAIVSVSDLERLEGEPKPGRMERWAAWEQGTEALARSILERRAGEPIQVDDLLEQDRQELESRLG